MPRPLVFGNGRFLIAFDRRHRARDLFCPNVGYPNHLLGHPVRTGVWVDGEFGWCDSDDWEIHQSYEEGSLVGRSLWRSWRLGIEISVLEALDPVEPVFVREFQVSDLRGLGRRVRIYTSQNFILGQSDVGNTAFWHPYCEAVVHYRGPHYAVVALRSGAGRKAQYATGLTGFGNLEGTWRDAEDGELSGNPIAQGSVDSTLGVEVAPNGQEAVRMVLVCGSRLDETVALFQGAEARGWDRVFSSARVEGSAWAGRAEPVDLEPFSQRVKDVYDRSLHIVRSQIDAGGAIVAANDSDILLTNRATYSYCWPRDGACVSRLMAEAGFPEVAESFLRFCTRIEPRDQPFFLQKYRSDGNLGASWHPWIVDGRPEVPFQEDESALVLLLLAEQAPTLAGDWEPFGRKLAQAVADHRTGDGLPKPSWDLWEERHGVHFFTACLVVAALKAASVAWNEPAYDRAAVDTLAGIEARFWTGARYRRMLGDETADSAVLGGMLFCPGLSKERQAATLADLDGALSVSGPIGGLARYAGDYYFRKTERAPGNPWIISTMWSARMHARLGDLSRAVLLVEWAAERAETTGVLAEQYHPDTGEPLSVSPLTWSHAEFLETVRAVAKRPPKG